MAALAQDAPTSTYPGSYSNASRNTQAAIVKNNTQIYVGGFVDVVAGVLQPHAAGATSSIGGIAVGPGVPGNSPVMDNASLGLGIGPGIPTGSAIPKGNVTTAGVTAAVQAVYEPGAVILKGVTLAVAGTLTGAYTNDVGKELYCATDNPADCSTTQTSSDKPVGHIVALLSYDAVAATAVYDIQVLDANTRLGY